MGTIAQQFESGEQSSKKGQFRNLVMLARIDGKIDAEERELLNRMARKLSLTDEQVKEILNDSNNYPMIPPVSREERYERFIILVQMIYVDGSINAKEEVLAKRFGYALGFTQERIEEKYPIIAEKVKAGLDRDSILESIL